MSCELREAFLRGSLAGPDVARWAAHLETCADCRAVVEHTQRHASALRAWASAGPMPPFAPARLVARARTARRMRRLAPLAALALVGVVALSLWPRHRPLLLENAGTVAIGSDWVTVDEGARAQVEQRGDETRVTISAGSLGFHVAKRAAGQRFVVETSGVEVRVVGTRFSVQAGPQPTVTVTEGVVEVWVRAAQVAVLRAGQSWPPPAPPEPASAPDAPVDAGAAEPPPVRPPAPKPLDVEAVTQAMLGGRLDDALRVLEAHLARAPQDARAWLLLGDVQRRAAAPAKAVDAYRKAATFGADADLRTRARLFAASLLQDSLGDAAGARPLLEACLKERQGPKALEAPVLVRLARLDASAGNVAEARRRLQLVLERHATTPSAVEARQLLDSLR